MHFVLIFIYVPRRLIGCTASTIEQSALAEITVRIVMTDITQKLLDSEGITEIKEGETFDLHVLSISFDWVTVYSGAVGVDVRPLVRPLDRNDGAKYLRFERLTTMMGYTWFERMIGHEHRSSAIFSADSVLFANRDMGLTSKLTHVYVSGRGDPYKLG